MQKVTLRSPVGQVNTPPELEVGVFKNVIVRSDGIVTVDAKRRKRLVVDVRVKHGCTIFIHDGPNPGDEWRYYEVHIEDVPAPAHESSGSDPGDDPDYVGY